ncbi:ras-related and estrogen-regulated growth inhibitor isoform X1 [Hippopotamus amphibius kiboko]|uniref:ras-related and estrogen-regulated growth inhibitor isoform X1 n=1 Tax=Hippopotamus amphibius kiboko TaxID=575201 RepID=UPI0025925082|nr:ras-related and estrogen-regulated growth inhibitor isoform X1 [Hippopotamus amphibius kiboko]
MAKSAEVKLAIFGRAGVGKSALVVRFLTKRFIWEYDPTLENVSAMYYACVNDHYTWLMAESTYRHQATIDDEVVTMEILDTAGQEDTIQREGHMRWGEGFVLVYDITDRGSFEEVLPLKNILDEIKKPKNVTLILVGNKADLDHSRQVSTEEGEKLATELACAFYECSACTGEGNITEIFYELCREVRRRRMVQGKTRRRSSTTHVKQAINKMLTKISS